MPQLVGQVRQVLQEDQMFSWHPHDRQVLAFGIQKSMICGMYLNDMAFFVSTSSKYLENL